MGFFSKARKRISKFIPKEVKPFLPYIAAGMIPGPGAGMFSSAIGNKFMAAAAARGLSDDEADLKDIARTGIFASAPTALSKYGKGTGMGAKYAKTAGDYIAKQGALKTGAAQGAVDMGIKAAELNEDALAKYNAEMAAQGINDKAGRRSAIRAIYSNTGTWDMNEVDDMLDTYGYRTGGRVGYGKGGFSEEKYKNFVDSFEFAQDGLEYLEDDEEVMPIRELRLAEGGPVDALMERVKELQEEGLDFASAMAQAQKEMGASRRSLGGIMDINENVNIETPRGDVDVDVNSMESIKGQTAGPDWYQQRLEHLEFLGYNYETAGEIAYDTDRYMEVIEMDIGPGPGEGDDYARGGRVGLENGGGIMDIPIQDLAEDFEITFGRPAESIDELKDYYKRKYEFNGDTSDAGNKGVGNMAMTGDREWIIDSSRDNFANDMFGKDYDDLNEDETEEIDIIIEMELGKKEIVPERTMAASGGLMNLGGREMDLRGGGFVPMGKKERADDVPARLSKNEFVMTADAVRGAGGGSIKKGADLMHDQMKQLEAQA